MSNSSLYPPVFAIDIKQLYSKLLNTDTHHVRHIVDVARALKLPVQDGMCAGHEAAYVPLSLDYNYIESLSFNSDWLSTSGST